ncbi:MAG: phosphoglycerate kinase [Gammaproteobacteria bacterium]|jgi:phosphoglycerate kinase|nr:phosphoglycerate kinase [Gammaproteobacteria bacterium]
MNIPQMMDLDLKGKKTMIRLDLNVPIEHGEITSDARIKASIPTILAAQNKGAKVIVLSHLGRPDPDNIDTQFSLQPVAKRLGELINQDIDFIPNWIDSIPDNGNVVLCENTRYHQGEKSNDEELSKRIASLCDVYVMDAFGASHRKHASTYGAIKFSNKACAGPLLSGEIESLKKAMSAPEKPLVAIIGGAKVSSKLGVIESLANSCDSIIVGGGIANTFLLANGNSVGNSLIETEMIEAAKRILKLDQVYVPLPTDVVVAKEFSNEATALTKSMDQVEEDDLILDIGPETTNAYNELIASARTIIWNGPVGVFEIEQFSQGTAEIAKAIAANSGYKIVGGGDTVAVIEKYGISDSISYVSTGGGAFLEFVKNGTLDALEVLAQH